MNFDGFVAKYNGKSIDYDGYYGAQCVDSVAQYCIENGLPVAYANAKDWWQHPRLTGAFDFIKNNPNDLNQLPSHGNIIIWDGALAGSGGAGHIAMYDVRVRSGVFRSFDQNWGGMYCHFVEHNWNNVIGWMRPKQVAPAPAPALSSNQRILSNPTGVYQRSAPSTDASIIKDWPYDQEPFSFKGFVHGQSVNGSDVWYVGAYSGGYFHSKAFADSSTNGLVDLTVPKEPEPPKPVEPAPLPDTKAKVLDISSNNTVTDYALLKANIRGVIAKAGHTGVSFKGIQPYNSDPTFATNKLNLGDKLSGAYWYGYASLNAVTEAHNFVDTVGAVPENFTYWLDIEESDGKTDDEVNAWCQSFLITVDGLTNKRCGIYMNRNWYDTHINAVTKSVRPIWLAHYDTPEMSNPVERQVAHQYTSKGAVQGVSGNVDLNAVTDDFFKPTKLDPPQVPPVEPTPDPDAEPTHDYGAENNALLKQILAIVQWIRDKISGIFN